MIRAIPFAWCLADTLNFIEARHVFSRHPKPRSRPRAFCARFARLRQPFLDRQCCFRSEPGSFKVGRSHKKVLCKDFRIRFECHYASVECGQFFADRIQQAFAAKRNLGSHRLSTLSPLTAKVQSVRQERDDPRTFRVHVDTFSRRSFQSRPPVATARQNLDSRIGIFERDSRQLFGLLLRSGRVW